MAGARDREHHDRQRDAWMLANQLQPWSRNRLRPEDFYLPESPTAGLTKRQKTDEFLRRLVDQGQVAPEDNDG